MKGRNILFAVLAVGLVVQAHAITNYWINPGVGLWNIPTNWATGAIPGNDEARIGNGGTALIDDSQVVSASFVVMGDTNGTSGTLRMTGGILVCGFDVRVGGTILGAGAASTGFFEQSGGFVFMNDGNVNVGYGIGSAGTYNLSGGDLQINSGAIFAIGNRTSGTVNQSNGTVYVRGFSAPGTAVTQIGRNTATIPASGTYNLSGGILLTPRLQFGNAVGGAGSINVFNLTDTGMLICNSISVTNTSAFNAFNFTGGTLVANGLGITLVNNGGTFSPGRADFASNEGTTATNLPINPISVAVFTTNSYFQGSNGTLRIDIAATGSNDFVDIGLPDATGLTGSSASLEGTIAVHVLDEFNPPLHSTFDILVADSITNHAVVTGLTPDGYGFRASTFIGDDGRYNLRLTVVVTPARLSVPVVLGDGSIQIAFAGSVGALYSVSGSTNIALPLSNWPVLGPATETSPGQYQFTDVPAPGGSQRFYAVFAQ